MIPVNAVEKKEDETIVFNLSADAANDDWIRATRLLKKGDSESLEELKELENTVMYSER